MSGRATSLDLEAYSESLYPERFGLSPLRALHDGRYKLIEAPRATDPEAEAPPAEPIDRAKLPARFTRPTKGWRG